MRVENARHDVHATATSRARCFVVPVAHGDGRYIADDATLDELEGEGRVVFRYVDATRRRDDGGNPNGSMHAIAGIINARGNVLGMMPHPERACRAAARAPTTDCGIFESLAAHLQTAARHERGHDATARQQRRTARRAAGRSRDHARRSSPSTGSRRRVRADLGMLGREPTFTELGVFSALWSEHCSYKHSRPLLTTLPTKAP